MFSVLMVFMETVIVKTKALSLEIFTLL